MTRALDALLALTGGRPPRQTDEGIHDLATGPIRAHYDRIAPLYHPLMRSAVYQRLAWRSSPSSYRSFAARVFGSHATGAHIELGCGSLLFTLELYDEDRGRPIILIDQSIAMLRMARRRLIARHGAMPDHVVLVRADGRDLVVRNPAATTVLSMHVLHVVDEGAALLRTLSSLAAPGGATLGLTSIFATGDRGDTFLRFLNRIGELAAPRDLATVTRMVAEHVPGRIDVTVEGSMSFATVSR